MRIELFESVLGGTEDALTQRQADLVIGAIVPPGFAGEPLMRLRFVAVAAPAHPLHALTRPLTYQDLRRHRQLVIRDSGRLAEILRRAAALSSARTAAC